LQHWRERLDLEDGCAKLSAGAGATAARAGARAAFVTWDNRRNRTDIERHYRAAVRSAHRRVLIANAYFFPGYRLLSDLRQAARRGVRLDLILQDQIDMPWAQRASELLYGYLIRAGVRVYEYTERPLHGKVAVVDDYWATVGSSNLDPTSLSLNLEANVVVRDETFAKRRRTHPVCREQHTVFEQYRRNDPHWP
jgi:cardiolipin synthase